MPCSLITISGVSIYSFYRIIVVDIKKFNMTCFFFARQKLLRFITRLNRTNSNREINLFYFLLSLFIPDEYGTIGVSVFSGSYYKRRIFNVADVHKTFIDRKLRKNFKVVLSKLKLKGTPFSDNSKIF